MIVCLVLEIIYSKNPNTWRWILGDELQMARKGNIKASSEIWNVNLERKQR